MKRIILAIYFTIMMTTFAITLLNPFGPTILPIAHILNGYTGNDIKISFWRTPEQAIAAIKSEKAEFYVLPLTLGANLYAKGFDLVLLGIHEWKVFYLVSKEDLKDLTDLKGKIIYSAHSKGTVVDVLLRYYLESEGLKPDIDVRIVYAQPNEIVALFKAGKVSFAALPEPFVTILVLSSHAHIILDFQKKWKELTGLNERIPIAGLFTTKKILKKPCGKITAEYVANALGFSTELMKEHPNIASEVTSKITNIPSKILYKSMERMVFYYVPIEKCKEEVKKFLETLHRRSPQGLPSLPDEDFYQ